MAGRATGVSYQDSSLLNELLDALDQDPNNIEAKKLLAGQYQAFGWDDAAVNIAEEVLAIDPNDREAQFVRDSSRGRGSSTHQSPDEDAPPPYSPGASDPTTTDTDPARDAGSIRQLKDAYKILRDEAKNLLQELLCFQKIAPNEDCKAQISDLTALTEGRVHSVARRKTGQPLPSRGSAAAGPSNAPKGPPPTIRVISASMKVDKDTALDIAVADFTDFVQWSKKGRIGANANDAARDAVWKRAESLKTILPKKMAYLAMDAFMHVEHEVLKRTYLNTETMTLMEPVADIPRAYFWASEDGYAWDMTELVQAIKSNGGSMRNPLSGETFTVNDVEAIIRHSHGKGLAAIQVEQKQLSKGVRQETITKMRTLADVILEDQSVNSHPSHEAVDGFLSYMATLPTGEREALDKLRVPARDSHTGKAFDATIGDSVRDAKTNQICFHKAGDLLKQAVDFLTKTV